MRGDHLSSGEGRIRPRVRHPLDRPSKRWFRSPQQQRQFRGDDCEQINSARQAAEALFTPKPEVTEQPVSDSSLSRKARKPRVLPILSRAPIRQQTVDAPATPQPVTAPNIPAKERARLRTLLKYGMTISQVADVYRVPVETIERISSESLKPIRPRPAGTDSFYDRDYASATARRAPMVSAASW